MRQPEAGMTAIRVRSARWPEDVPALKRIDTGFVTNTFLQPERSGFLFNLVETAVNPPIQKAYVVELTEKNEWDYLAVAEVGGVAVGFAAAQYAPWNRRVILHHLYVDRSWRGRGIGSRLLDALEGFARPMGARCLWVETQNVNPDAVRFYLKNGFLFCGFDETLYDDGALEGAETALFFSRPVP